MRSRRVSVLEGLTLCLVLLRSPAQGQVTEEWVARYDSPDHLCDEATAIAVDSSGNAYVTGQYYTTIKYSPDGSPLWIATYAGSGEGFNVPWDLALDEALNVYVTGWSLGTESGFGYATVKYDAAGNELWTARYNGDGNGHDYAWALGVDRGGNVYVTGSSDTGDGLGEYATIKYGPAGEELWVALYEPPNGWGSAMAVAVDGTGNAYVTGTAGGPDLNGNYVTLKYDPDGNLLWEALYSGPGESSDIARAISLDRAGNVCVTGSSIASGFTDYATVKYDAGGNQLWVARYDGPGRWADTPRSIASDSAGNVYVTGFSGGGETDMDYGTVKYDPDGNLLWVARYDGPVSGRDEAIDLALDDRGNVYVTGSSEGGETGVDYATVKYSPEGDVLWVARYDGPFGGDLGSALAVDRRANVYVTGASAGSGTSCDYATIKYRQELVGIGEPRPTAPPPPKRFSLSPNFPNPFNPSTDIRYTIPEHVGEGAQVSLVVFDIRGQKVATLVNERQKPGAYVVQWDGTSDSGVAVPSGVYFYRLEAGPFSTARKMTLLK